MDEDKPLLRSYHFKLVACKEAAALGRLLTLRIDTNERCNLKCRYCAWDSERTLTREIDFRLLKKIIGEGERLGIKSVIIIGGGEPTLYYAFRDLIKYINDKNLIPVLITNATKITAETAAFLDENNASVCIKYDSIDSDVQDYLAGKEGYAAMQKTNLENLFRAYGVQDEASPRIAISFVITKKNLDDCEKIWRFCRRNHYIPNPNIFNRRGRGLINAGDLEPTSDEVNRLFEQFEAIDAAFGYKRADSELKEAPCLQHLYSVYMDVHGFVSPCPAVRFEEFDIRNQSLEEIMQSKIFTGIKKTYACLSKQVKPAMVNLS
jgi:MoaA/NifB/PqqE/SkfB family radical SAM enzyme